MAALAAAAVAPGPSPHGIWQGSIGNLPIRACFLRREWGTSGAYYYLSRLQLIALSAREQDGAYTEGGGDDPKQPRWTIDRTSGGSLTGRWSGNGRTLPIHLTRIATPAEDGSPCASGDFHAPRLAGVRSVARPARKDGVGYTRLTLNAQRRFDASVDTFQLHGSGAATRRINTQLLRPLSGDPAEWFDCVRSALENGPFEGSYNATLEPAFVSKRWLSVVNRYDSFCGGAHPDAGLGYRMFGLADGREVDLHDWLTDAAVKRDRLEGSAEPIKTLRPALRQVVLAGWKADDAECAEIVKTAEFWSIGLARTAFVLSPELPHVAQACAEEFTVPFSQLRPFLTHEAARQIDALQAERIPGR
jgi:hypothetical protein